MSCRNIDIKDEFIKELKEELRLRQAELEGSRCLIKQIGSTLRKAWEEHKEGEPYPGFNDEDIGWVFDSLAELEQLRHYVNCLSRLVDTLAEELETLKQNPPAGEMEQAKDYLIDLFAPEIIWAEENLKSMGPKQRERVTEIVAVYRTLRPKEGEANAD